MADQQLNFIINAQDRSASAFKQVEIGISSMQKKVESMKPTFQKMALAGGIALGAITAAFAVSIQEAAKAEGSYNKFNTVFGEYKDDMLKFVDDIRTRMPAATHEIVRLAADLQDLLVPLGLSRELATDMTKGFLEVSNQIAAFNDVDPTEVINAIGSALAGSSEPLRRFGVNALETSLEVRAMEMGLLDAGQGFKDLDVDVKNQIRAQALLAQIVDNSSDAIAGFEANNDSFIRRQQELNATIKETKEIIGKIFLPVVDDVLKKILPLVSKISQWIELHPELSKGIILITAGLSALVFVIGALGLAIIAFQAVAWPTVGIVLLITAGVAALIAIIYLLITNWGWLTDTMVKMTIQLKEMLAKTWKGVADNITETFNNLINFFKAFWEALKGIFMEYVTAIVDMLNPLVSLIQKVMDGLSSIGGGIQSGLNNVGKALDVPFLQVQDAVITPQGKVIQTDPADYLIATKTPGALAGAGNITVNINGGYYLSENVAEDIGNKIIDKLKRVIKI